MSEPMTEERLAEIAREFEICFGRQVDGSSVSNSGGELLAEVHRLRDLPPDVAAAMEEYKRERHAGNHMQWIEVMQQKSQAAVTIAAHFTALFHPTPKVQP